MKRNNLGHDFVLITTGKRENLQIVNTNIKEKQQIIYGLKQ